MQVEKFEVPGNDNYIITIQGDFVDWSTRPWNEGCISIREEGENYHFFSKGEHYTQYWIPKKYVSIRYNSFTNRVEIEVPNWFNTKVYPAKKEVVESATPIREFVHKTQEMME